MSLTFGMQEPVTQARANRVLVIEAEAGPARRRWLETHAQQLGGPAARSFSLCCDFDESGPWAGVNTLFSALIPGMANERPDLIDQHVFELVHVLPQLRRSLTVSNPCLTDLAPVGERSRNYAADRAFRIVNGLVDLLDRWKSGHDGERDWIIVCDSLDAAGALNLRFFKELMRRRGERLHLRLLAGVCPGNGDAAAAVLAPGATVTRVGLQHEATAEMDSTTAAELASGLEARIGEDALEKQLQLHELLRLWRLAHRPDKVLEYKYLGLEICNPLGLYEDALRYADGILEMAMQYAPGNEFLRWSIVMKLLACYSSLQQADAALNIAETYGLESVKNHPAWRAQVFYMVAMLHARYKQPRDLAKGEQYLEEGLAALEEAGLSENELHLHSVFNRNGLAMIRSFQGRHAEALELCRTGIARLNAHLAADKHRLHRSVLVYNIAQVYAATGSHDQALEHYAAVIAMDPNYSEYYNERGNLLLRLGRLEEALADYLKAVELSPPYVEVFTNLAQCYRRMGAMAKAVEAYSRALDLKPDQSLALLGRGKAREELGHSQEALADYTAAIKLEPAQWEAVASCGVLHYDAGDLLASLADFDRAIELQPGEADLYANRATVLADLGLHQRAIRDLSRILDLNPEHADRREIEARLEAELRAHEAAMPEEALQASRV
jgi:tetratricopeptide (TPR) repeat protein